MSSVPTRRELVAWLLAVVLALSVVMLTRGGSADAGVAFGQVRVVYVATGENFPDALGAAAAAAVGLGPVLLVQQNTIPGPTLAELERLQPPEIVIVGGTSVISDGVKAQLEALGWGPSVTRLAGANRYATAAALSAATFPTSGSYPIAVHAGGNQSMTVTPTPAVVRSVTVAAPRAGVVVVNSTANPSEITVGDFVLCSITTGTDLDGSFAQRWQSGGSSASTAQLAGTRGFAVAADQELTINLVCAHFGSSGSSSILDSALTAIFIADT